MKKIIIFAITTVGFLFNAQASQFTYDVSGSSGSKNGNSYSEIHLGLNYMPEQWFNWRNSLFSQFGSNMDTIYGLDSSALFSYDVYNTNRTAGFEVFAGPGVRVATEDANALTGKAGIAIALAGIRVGGGVQYLRYFENRYDKDGGDLGKDDTQVFITISGGGAF